jgi:predicted RecB family nuclease
MVTISRSFLREIKELHQGLSTPMLVLNNYCQVCEFHDRCRAQALKEDNLSLLQGMNKLQITRLNNTGFRGFPDVVE